MEPKERRRGRGAPRRYDKALVVYLTEADLEAAHALAEQHGQSASAYMRQLLREAAQREKME